MKKAVVTGVYGQDGSFLCELLIQKGYQVFGIANKELSLNSAKVKEELEDKHIVINICDTDIYDYDAVGKLVKAVQPDEIYHMAAYHASSEGIGNANSVREQEVFNRNVLATANILEACFRLSKNTKILTAGSCLMYDESNTLIQDENTPFCSNSLYGMAKIAENMLVQFYRKKKMFSCTAILYNHESHRRASQFVTKKIVENMVGIKKGTVSSFTLGSLDIEKDWGYAGDYAEAMWRMLQAEHPGDFIVATGETHTIREFAAKCADILGISDWEKHVVLSESIVSRKIRGKLVGDSEAIRKELKWCRSKSFEEMVEEMVQKEMLYAGI